MPVKKTAATKKAPATKKSAGAEKKSGRKPAAKAADKAPASRPNSRKEVLMDGSALKKAIGALAKEILEEFPSPEGLMLLGIRTRGVVLAERIRAILEKTYKKPVASGILDITFYRDDLSRHGPNPTVRGSELPFDIHDAKIVLIDDVLFTGRTIRAAMDEINDFGRPAIIRLAIMVDRGLREYPIQPDYCALRQKTSEDQIVHVMLEEIDDSDQVILEKKKKG